MDSVLVMTQNFFDDFTTILNFLVLPVVAIILVVKAIKIIFKKDVEKIIPPLAKVVLTFLMTLYKDMVGMMSYLVGFCFCTFLLAKQLAALGLGLVGLLFVLYMERMFKNRV